jgi:hypothetical protein
LCVVCCVLCAVRVCCVLCVVCCVLCVVRVCVCAVCACVLCVRVCCVCVCVCVRCWICERYQYFRFVQFYGPLWIAICFNAYVFYSVCGLAAHAHHWFAGAVPTLVCP